LAWRGYVHAGFRHARAVDVEKPGGGCQLDTWDDAACIFESTEDFAFGTNCVAGVTWKRIAAAYSCRRSISDPNHVNRIILETNSSYCQHGLTVGNEDALGDMYRTRQRCCCPNFGECCSSKGTKEPPLRNLIVVHKSLAGLVALVGENRRSVGVERGSGVVAEERIGGIGDDVVLWSVGNDVLWV